MRMAVDLLIGMRLIPVREALAPKGFSEETLKRGWSLLERVGLTLAAGNAPILGGTARPLRRSKGNGSRSSALHFRGSVPSSSLVSSDASASRANGRRSISFLLFSSRYDSSRRAKSSKIASLLRTCRRAASRKKSSAPGRRTCAASSSSTGPSLTAPFSRSKNKRSRSSRTSTSSGQGSVARGSRTRTGCVPSA